MERIRLGYRQTNWWLPADLLEELRIYQHEQRLDSMTAAARQLLDQGLRRPLRVAKRKDAP